MQNMLTGPAPETEAVNEADRHGALAEETIDFDFAGVEHGVAAHVHATLALAAEVRAMRLQLGDALEAIADALAEIRGV